MNSPTEEIEFIKLPEVRKLTGVGTTKLYQMVNNGLFPPQVKLGGRAVAWVKSEVLQWNNDQIAAARGDQDSEAIRSK